MRTGATRPQYTFRKEVEGSEEFRRYLQRILIEHHEAIYPLTEVPKSQNLIIGVMDEEDQVVGGALIWAYLGRLDVSLLAMDTEGREQGLGRG